MSWRRSAVIVAVALVIVSGLVVTVRPSNGSTRTTEGTFTDGFPPRIHSDSGSVPEGASAPNETAGYSPLRVTPTSELVRTVFPGYNASIPGNFVSTVAGWQVGIPAYVPTTNRIWIPQQGVSVTNSPFPLLSPAAIFGPATGQFEGLNTNVANSTALAYDPGNGFLYATQPANNSVLVIDSRTGAVAHSSISVGTNPVAIAFDSGTGKVFVANEGSANVSVIDAASNRIIPPGVAVGAMPEGLAVDPRDGLLFVANFNSPYVSVIDTASTATILPTIPLAFGDGYNDAYSAKSGNVLVTIPGSDYATLIHASTSAVVTSLVNVGRGSGAVIANSNGSEFVVANGSGTNLVAVNSTFGTIIDSTIQTAANASSLVLDSSTGTVYSWSSQTRELWSTDLTHNTATPASPSVFAGPDTVGSDQRNGIAYVGGFSGTDLTMVNSTTFREISQAQNLSSGALSIAVDSGRNRAFVGTLTGVEIFNATTGEPMGAVSALSGANHQVLVDEADGLLWAINSIQGIVAVQLSTLSLALTPGIVVTSSSASAMAVALSVHELFVVRSPTSIAILNSANGAVIVPALVAGTNVTSVAYDPQDQGVYVAGDALSIIDTNSNRIVAWSIPIVGTHSALGVLFDPSRGAVLISVQARTLDHGGAVVLFDGSSIAASESAYATIRVGESPRDLTDVSLAATPSPGSTEIWVANNQSGTVSVISSPPYISYFAANPGIVDVGQRTGVQLHFEGGAGVSSISYSGLPTGCGALQSTQFNCTPTASGRFTLGVNVTDSLGYRANATTVLLVSPILGVQATYSPGTFPFLDMGIPLRGSATGFGGTPPFSFSWSFGDNANASGANATHAYAAPGTFVISVIVQDSTGATNGSSTSVVIEPQPTVAIATSPGNVTDVNQRISFTSSVGGGVGLLRENWAFGDGNVSSGSNVSHAWNRPGNYTVKFDYVDALGVAVNHSTSVTVHSSLGGVFSSGNASSASPAPPAFPVAFVSTPSGGTRPYNVTWSFGDGSYASGLSVKHSYASVGAYSVEAVLTDAVGASVSTNLSVFVAQNPSTSGNLAALNGGFGSGLFLGLMVGGVVAAVGLFAIGRRKGRRPSSGPISPYVPP